MNVAIFTDNDFDKVNGVTTTLCAALANAPADIAMRVYTASSKPVAKPDYLALRSAGVPIPFYGEMRMYFPRVRAYAAHARADRIDVIHLTTPGPMGLAALSVARRLNVPLVGSFHTDLAAYTALLSGSKRLGALMGQYMRWLYGCCSHVLVPSEHTGLLLAETGVNPEKIRVWTRGVDTDLFTPARRDEALRRRWGVDRLRPAILYVGRLSREKGLAVLPAASERLRARGFDHQLILAGQGPMERELRELLPQAIFTGVLSREDVAEAYASADLFIFPSRTDTAGNVVLEAQASGLPVVISGDGGPRENMEAGVTGVVCPMDAGVDWANAVEKVIRNPQQHAEMSVAARRFALGRRWSHALAPLFSAYHDVTADAAAMAPAIVPMPAGPGG